MNPVSVISADMILPDALGMDDLFNGRIGITRIPNEAPIPVAGRVKETLDDLPGWPFPSAPRALSLAHAAWLKMGAPQSDGLILGLSNMASEPDYIEPCLVDRDDPRKMSDLRGFGSDHALHWLADRVGATRLRLRVDSACASGSDALIAASRAVTRGRVGTCLVIAAASMVNPVGLAVFKNLRALSSTDDVEASKPFDLRRSGFVMGEGAAAALMSMDGPGLGRIAGFGQSMNAYKFTDLPMPPDAMADAVKRALGNRRDLAYICAHGTATRANDRVETQMIRLVLGNRADRTPVSSLKSMTGHCLGASSLIEVIVTLEALRRQMAPPTATLRVPDPDCDLDYVPLVQKPIGGRFALSQSFAFGGHNSAILLEVAS